MKKKTFLVLMIFALLIAGCSGAADTANGNYDEAFEVFDDAVSTAVAETLVASLADTAPDGSSDVAAAVSQALSADEPTLEPAPALDAASAPVTTQVPAVAASGADDTDDADDDDDVEVAGEGEDTVISARSEDVRAAAADSSSDDDDDDDKACYSATLVSETIPDGTVFSPGDGFAKSWTLKNTGSCEWGTDMRVVWVSGNSKFRASTDSKLTNKQIYPGDTVTITFEMGAPVEPGLYIALYKIIIEDTGKVVTPNGFWLSVWVDYE